MKAFLPWSLAALLAGEGLAIAGFQRMEAWGPVQYLSLILVWSAWIASLHAWGELALRRLFPKQVFSPFEIWGWSMALGTLLAALTAYSLVHVGVKGAGAAVAAALWMLLPHLGRSGRTNPRDFFAAVRQTFRSAQRWELAVFALFAVAAWSRFITATAVKTHGDVLAYHLLAPASWYIFGGGFDPEKPIIYLSGSWEYLYWWSFPLLHWPAREGGWIAAQLFSQLTHTYLGFLGCCFAVTQLISVPSWGWRVLAGLIAVNFNSALVTLATAKNDFGATYLTLAGIAGLSRFGTNGGRALPFWFLLGFAFSVKYTCIFLAAPAAAFFLLRHLCARPSARSLAWIGAAGVTGACLIPLRNTLGTGNPLFPTFNGLFHSSGVSGTVERTMHIVEGGGKFLHAGTMTEVLSGFFAQNPLFFPLLFIPVLVIARKQKVASLWVPALGLSSALLYAIKGSYEVRYLLPAGVLLGAVAGQALADFSTWSLRRWAPLAVLAVLPALNIPLYVYPQLFTKYVNPARIVSDHISGSRGKEWIRGNLDPAHVKLLTNDPELYYLARYRISDVLWNAETDALLSASPAPTALFEKFEKMGITHLLLDRLAYLPDKLLEPHVHGAVERCPEATVFHHGDSRVVDFVKLAACARSPRASTKN